MSFIPGALETAMRGEPFSQRVGAQRARRRKWLRRLWPFPAPEDRAMVRQKAEQETKEAAQAAELLRPEDRRDAVLVPIPRASAGRAGRRTTGSNVSCAECDERRGPLANSPEGKSTLRLAATSLCRAAGTSLGKWQSLDLECPVETSEAAWNFHKRSGSDEGG